MRNNEIYNLLKRLIDIEKQKSIINDQTRPGSILSNQGTEYALLIEEQNIETKLDGYVPNSCLFNNGVTHSFRMKNLLEEFNTRDRKRKINILLKNEQ